MVVKRKLTGDIGEDAWVFLGADFIHEKKQAVGIRFHCIGMILKRIHPYQRAGGRIVGHPLCGDIF